MDTTSQERTACRLGTGGGPSFMVPLGLWDSSISKSYGSYGNFHGFFFCHFIFGSMSSGDFADWKYLPDAFEFYFFLNYMISFVNLDMGGRSA